MIRKQEIINAAREYIDTVMFSLPSDAIYFEAGAEWADKHPINVWHDSSEEPSKHKYILFEYVSKQKELKYFVQYVTKNTYGMLQEFEKFGKCRWVYIDELLPKQPVNSEQPKGCKQ